MFDTEHVAGAIAYLSAPSEAQLQRVADTAAARHLRKHSAVTGYYPAGATTLDITRDLLSKPVEPGEISRVKGLLAEIRSAPGRQRACLADALRYLPEGFRFAEPLHLTWGYDIGVSMDGSASINLAHPRFAADPGEIWFYCTHEMHHAGLTAFQPFPRAVSEIRTAGQMLEFIRYATMLEGMAVHAARQPRQEDGALQNDPDYVALDDPVRMAAFEQAYWEIYQFFEAAGDRPLDEDDWRRVERLSDGDRLWYRVGALIASKIEADIGISAFRDLPRHGPDGFFGHYRRKTDLPKWPQDGPLVGRPQLLRWGPSLYSGPSGKSNNSDQMRPHPVSVGSPRSSSRMSVQTAIRIPVAQAIFARPSSQISTVSPRPRVARRRSSSASMDLASR